MVAHLAVEPVSAGTTNLMDYRYRPAMGERTLLPDSTQRAPTSARTGDRHSGAQPHKDEAHHQQTEPPPDRASGFAAAIIAGALPPTPKSMEELLRRIGSAEIPEESQARLRDLIA